MHQLLNALASDESTLADDVPQQLRDLADEVHPHDPDLAANLRQLAEVEAAEAPYTQASQQLWQRMPRFVRFNNRARELDSEYDINAADSSPGTALSNLVQLAELDLSALRTAVANEETGTVRDIREKANDTLAKKMEAWEQDPPITVSLENDGPRHRASTSSPGHWTHDAIPRAKRWLAPVRRPGRAVGTSAQPRAADSSH